MCTLKRRAHCRASRHDIRLRIESLETRAKFAALNVGAARQVSNALDHRHVPRGGLDDLAKDRSKLGAGDHRWQRVRGHDGEAGRDQDGLWIWRWIDAVPLTVRPLDYRIG
jgi:hypothetical protein